MSREGIEVARLYATRIGDLYLKAVTPLALFSLLTFDHLPRKLDLLLLDCKYGNLESSLEVLLFTIYHIEWHVYMLNANVSVTPARMLAFSLLHQISPNLLVTSHNLILWLYVFRTFFYA